MCHDDDDDDDGGGGGDDGDSSGGDKDGDDGDRGLQVRNVLGSHVYSGRFSFCSGMVRMSYPLSPQQPNSRSGRLPYRNKIEDRLQTLQTPLDPSAGTPWTRASFMTIALGCSLFCSSRRPCSGYWNETRPFEGPKRSASRTPLSNTGPDKVRHYPPSDAS